MSDRNYPLGDFANRRNETIGPMILRPKDTGAGVDDVFKNSNCVGCTFNGITVIAGRQRENGWDMNNECCDNTYNDIVIDGGGQSAFLRKGGSCRNTINGLLITTPGANSDWYEGDYSDQSAKKSQGNINRRVFRMDGQPVRVAWAFFRSEKPRFHESGPIRYQYFLSFIRTVYVELKYLFPKLIP